MSIPGSSPLGPVPSARAMGKGGNKAGVGSELSALLGHGSGQLGRGISHSSVGHGEHRKLFGFVLSDPPIS